MDISHEKQVVFDQIRSVACLDDDKIITDSDSLFMDYSLDSLSIVSIYLAIEDQLGLDFEYDDLLKIETVGDLLQLIKRKTEAKKA